MSFDVHNIFFFYFKFPDLNRITISIFFFSVHFFLFIFLASLSIIIYVRTTLAEKYSDKAKTSKKRDSKSNDAIKCVVVGEGKVGKTNLILGYLQHRFTTEHVPTASDIYNCKEHERDENGRREEKKKTQNSTNE